MSSGLEVFLEVISVARFWTWSIWNLHCSFNHNTMISSPVTNKTIWCYEFKCSYVVPQKHNGFITKRYFQHSPAWIKLGYPLGMLDFKNCWSSCWFNFSKKLLNKIQLAIHFQLFLNQLSTFFCQLELLAYMWSSQRDRRIRQISINSE